MGITNEQVERINALARKSKAEGLTPDEKAEQFELRQAYIAAVRANLSGLLDTIRVVEATDEVTIRTGSGELIVETDTLIIDASQTPPEDT